MYSRCSAGAGGGVRLDAGRTRCRLWAVAPFRQSAGFGEFGCFGRRVDHKHGFGPPGREDAGCGRRGAGSHTRCEGGHRNGDNQTRRSRRSRSEDQEHGPRGAETNGPVSPPAPRRSGSERARFGSERRSPPADYHLREPDLASRGDDTRTAAADRVLPWRERGRIRLCSSVCCAGRGPLGLGSHWPGATTHAVARGRPRLRTDTRSRAA
jgi:hypothetical protein